MVFPLMECVDGPPRPGHMSFPFSIQLPGWLPASMVLAGSNNERATLSVEYFVNVMFEHVNPVHSFKKTRYFMLQNQRIQTPTYNLSESLQANVGGCCGCGTSRCTALVRFEKDHYYLGETANVRIRIDNSACKKDVSQIKLELRRYYLGRDSGGKNLETSAKDSLVIKKNIERVPRG